MKSQVDAQSVKSDPCGCHPHADSEGPWTTSGSREALRDTDPATFPNTVPLLPQGAESDQRVSGAHQGLCPAWVRPVGCRGSLWEPEADSGLLSQENARTRRPHLGAIRASGRG